MKLALKKIDPPKLLETFRRSRRGVLAIEFRKDLVAE